MSRTADRAAVVIYSRMCLRDMTWTDIIKSCPGIAQSTISSALQILMHYGLVRKDVSGYPSYFIAIPGILPLPLQEAYAELIEGKRISPNLGRLERKEIIEARGKKSPEDLALKFSVSPDRISRIWREA